MNRRITEGKDMSTTTVYALEAKSMAASNLWMPASAPLLRYMAQHSEHVTLETDSGDLWCTRDDGETVDVTAWEGVEQRKLPERSWPIGDRRYDAVRAALIRYNDATCVTDLE
jgi:hypothetical protein